MKLGQAVVLLEGRAISADFDPDLEVCAVAAADLMSDVLTYAHECAVLLLTGLPNPLVVRTAEVAGIQAIAFVRGKEPAQDTIDLAGDKGIPLATTRLTMFEACGRLYGAGLPGVDTRGRLQGPTREPARQTLEQAIQTRPDQP